MSMFYISSSIKLDSLTSMHREQGLKLIFFSYSGPSGILGSDGKQDTA